MMSETEVATLRRDVCSTPEGGHWTDIPGGPFSAINGSRLLFDHLVGEREQSWRDRQAERLRALEIDDKLERCRQFDW